MLRALPSPILLDKGIFFQNHASPRLSVGAPASRSAKIGAVDPHPVQNDSKFSSDGYLG